MDVETQLNGLVRRWAGFWPDVDVVAVAADLRARAAEAVRVWELAAPRALAGGHVGLVLAAERRGRPVVAKLSPRGHADEAQLAAEGDALAFWSPTGAVPRLEASRDGGLTLLMERLRPGAPLDGSRVGWPLRLETLGRLAARLHAAGPPPSGFEHIGGAYARDWRVALADEPETLDLLRPCDSDVLLHADLHGANALRHEGGWRAIDPHAVRGDRHADVWALIDPLAPPLPPDDHAATVTARAWVEHYARAAELDADRAAAWVRLRARAEARLLGDEDPAWAERLARMAEALGRVT